MNARRSLPSLPVRNSGTKISPGGAGLSRLPALVAASLLVFILFMFQHIIDRLVYYPMRYPEGDWNLQAKPAHRMCGSLPAMISACMPGGFRNRVLVSQHYFCMETRGTSRIGSITRGLSTPPDRQSWLSTIADTERAKAAPAKRVWAVMPRRPMTRLRNSASRRAKSFFTVSHLEAR